MLSAAQAEAHKQSSLSNGGKLSIEIKNGKDLCVRDKSMFSKGSSDPYIKIMLGGSRKVGTTKVIKKSLNPIWNESFQIEVGGKDKPFVVLEIFDKDMLSSDDPMGIITISLTDLVHGQVIDKNFKVEKCTGANDASGTVHIVAMFDPRVSTSLQSGATVPLESKRVKIGLGWDYVGEKRSTKATASAVSSKLIDLDASAVVFDKRGSNIETIYFDNLVSKRSGAGAIVHLGDSRDGEGVFGGDDESIVFDTSRLSQEVHSSY